MLIMFRRKVYHTFADHWEGRPGIPDLQFANQREHTYKIED